jgi:uroporphyrinogen III methyltransferase/synthase
LRGKTIVVTRARAQAREFAARLHELGASVIEFPTIRVADPPDPDALRTSVSEVASYDWIVFTSVNGVERFWAVLRSIGGNARTLATTRVCAIGPATGAALERRGVGPELVPSKYVAEAVVGALSGLDDLRGKRILLPRAAVARATLPEGLRALGATVDEVAAYRTERDGLGVEEVRRRLFAGEVDLITFTASSTVSNFVELLGANLAGSEVASIGPITSRTARELGLPVHVEAAEYTIPGLVLAIANHYTRL